MLTPAEHSRKFSSAQEKAVGSRSTKDLESNRLEFMV